MNTLLTMCAVKVKYQRVGASEGRSCGLAAGTHNVAEGLPQQCGSDDGFLEPTLPSAVEAPESDRRLESDGAG